VQTIGDPALKNSKSGVPGFERVFDLATEWYDWQKMPFVFAVWAVKKSVPAGMKRDLNISLRKALAREEREHPSLLSTLHGRRIGMTQAETAAYLAGITFRLGKAERAAIEVFRKLAIPDPVKRIKRVTAKRET
jgi:chorismate dehydratase